MTEFDFSQSGEQAMILEWARRHGIGRWLDIGAADGVAASNTRALAELGWPGVAVEPAGWLFDKLAGLYRDRPDVGCVQAAVTVLSRPIVRFHYARDLVSTTEEANAATWSELVEFTPCYVAAVTVSELLEMLPGPYDFITVDCEGTSLEVAEALLKADALARGGLLCVECENGAERWTAQQWCLNGLARVGVTPNNLLLERL